MSHFFMNLLLKYILPHSCLCENVLMILLLFPSNPEQTEMKLVRGSSLELADRQ